jgi:hypothetical protein
MISDRIIFCVTNCWIFASVASSIIPIGEDRRERERERERQEESEQSEQRNTERECVWEE